MCYTHIKDKFSPNKMSNVDIKGNLMKAKAEGYRDWVCFMDNELVSTGETKDIALKKLFERVAGKPRDTRKIYCFQVK